jgi:uncharacterized membrane protein YkvA (DUF1232 family)
MTLRGILGAHYLHPLRIGRFLSHLPSFLRVFYGLMNDSRVSLLTKLVPLLAVAWLISPPGVAIDLIPLIGELDALLVIYFALKIFLWLCPPEVVREHVMRVANSSLTGP